MDRGTLHQKSQQVVDWERNRIEHLPKYQGNRPVNFLWDSNSTMNDTHFGQSLYLTDLFPRTAMAEFLLLQAIIQCNEKHMYSKSNGGFLQDTTL